VGPRAGLDGRKISSHRDSIPDRPARSQSLYRLSYPAHCCLEISKQIAVSDTCLLLYVQSWTPDDGRKDHPKHVECNSKII